jgi:hypothetical protein
MLPLRHRPKHKRGIAGLVPIVKLAGAASTLARSLDELDGGH